jgi:molybdate transport system regulatory protein
LFPVKPPCTAPYATGKSPLKFAIHFLENAMSDETTAHIADPIELSRHLSSLADKRLDILRRIKETGSISEAARTAKVSYKAAWQALETLGNLAGSPLVEKVVGGVKGGGSRLTETGEQLLELSARLAKAREAVLADFARQKDPNFMRVTASTLQTSMRNHIPCRIEHISRGPAMARVLLRIDEQNTLKASLTLESAQLMELREGLEVLALFKATAIDVERSIHHESRENILSGTVVRCARKDRGGEVTLRLSGGLTVVGFCRPRHGLHPGETAEAFISQQAIAIGLFT